MSQVTKNCHIIPKRYIKNFLNDEKEIFYSSKTNNRKIEKSDKNFSFASKDNVYNYINSGINIIDEYEKYLHEKETKLSDTTKKLLESFKKGLLENNYNFKYNEKIDIIRIIMILYEKITYYVMRNTITNGGKYLINKSEYGLLFTQLNHFLISFYCLLFILTGKDFSRFLLYSPDNKIYFGDIPFHINSKGKHIQWEGFFNNHGSSVYLPLSKNFAVYILYSKDKLFNKYFYNLGCTDYKSKFSNDIIERVLVNSDEYIAGPNENYLKFLLTYKNGGIKKNKSDIFFRQMKFITPKEISNLFKDLNRYKNIDFDLTSINLINIGEEALEIYKSIDDKLSIHGKIADYLSILTGMDGDEIHNLLKSRKYIEFFRDSQRNINSTNNFFSKTNFGL